MKILILTVLLAVMQALSPIPGKAADNPAGAGQDVKDNSSQNQKPTAEPMAVRNPNESPSTKRDTGQQSHNDTEHTVGISKLPPVSVTRSWLDWGLWVFSGLLVLVGALQIWLLLGTLRAIKRQADNMDRQSDILKDTGERQLRAYVSVSRAQLKIGKGIIRAQVHIKNYGQTPAYEVRQWIHKWVESHPLSVALPEPSEDFKMATAILGPGDHNVMDVSWQMPPNLVLGTRASTVYIYGKILYKDAFGRTRYAKYRLIHGGSEPLPNPVVDDKGILTVGLKSDAEGNDAD
jgi:hypothetical protein